MMLTTVSCDPCRLTVDCADWERAENIEVRFSFADGCIWQLTSDPHSLRRIGLELVRAADAADGRRGGGR